MSSTPEPWKSAMEARGIASERDLGRRCGIHQTTIGTMIRGTRKTSPGNLRKVADALGVSVAKVTEWAGQAVASLGPYEPPARAELLSPTQRRALDAVITAMLEDREDGESGGNTAPMTPAPANEPVKLDDRRRTEAPRKKAARKVTQPKGPAPKG